MLADDIYLLDMIVRDPTVEANECWEAPEGQVRCNPEKREADTEPNQCREASEGQIHCAMMGKREAEAQEGNPWSCGAPICRRNLATGLLAPYIVERDAEPQEGNPWSCGAPICRRDPATGFLVPDLIERGKPLYLHSLNSQILTIMKKPPTLRSILWQTKCRSTTSIVQIQSITRLPLQRRSIHITTPKLQQLVSQAIASLLARLRRRTTSSPIRFLPVPKRSWSRLRQRLR